MKLFFSSIKNGNIFNQEFQNLKPSNGTIEFKKIQGAGGLAVVYAPNGTGKSSLTNVLKSKGDSKYLNFYAKNDNGETISPASGLFHIIQDQLNRNIIQGKETDYLIGAQIRREYELRDHINNLFDLAFNKMNLIYKNDFKVSKVNDYLLNYMNSNTKWENAHKYIRDIVKVQSKGKNIDRDEFVAFLKTKRNLQKNIDKVDDKKKQFLINECCNSKVIEIILAINPDSIEPCIDSIKIERHDDAITLLQKYHNLDSCIVCDNTNFNGDSLLKEKTEKRKRIYDSLDSKTKDLIDNVIEATSLDKSDPFEIKKIIRDFISGSDLNELQKLKQDIKNYLNYIIIEMIGTLYKCFDNTDFFTKYEEYEKLTQIDPQLDNEEILFIQEVINENIGRDIKIERDENSRNYKLKIEDKDLIGANLRDLELSTGEQNFISLSFDLLFARRSNCPYVVLDDPISSFDSVYKNKIAFCIIKFLNKKNQIILTHNTDLIRLLNVQLNNCFNLYILSRVDGGKNGFIQVKQQELQLLINLHDLVCLFQGKKNGEVSLYNSIIDRRVFLMAMIPFMRGYAHISIDPNNYYGLLSKIMHGYGKESLDIVPIYKNLFGYDFKGSEIVSVEDILKIDCEKIDILDSNVFPLLAETLKQTLIYYHLRMLVEKELVSHYDIRTDNNPMLAQIINRAFKTDGKNEKKSDLDIKRRFKVFFNSRKTLLNEFNHFEGNLNIFQPAIDITPEALRKEISDIKTMLKKVRAYANKS